MKRPLLANLGLSLAVTLVLVVALEGTARVVEGRRKPRKPVAEYIWDWDRMMPGGFYVMKSDAAGWPPWEEINGDGLRDRTRPREKPEGVRRVAVLGDSVTLGAEIRPEQAYPQRLEARLAAEGRPLEVMNVALWGWSTRQERIAWQRIARAYRPDQAVLAVCLNDIPELFNNLTRPPRWLARLHGTSALVRLVVSAEGREIDNVERLFAEPDAVRVREAMDRFFGEIRALRHEVEADGARFALVVFPFRFQVQPGAPAPVVQDRIASFCATEGLRCLDLLPPLSGVGPSAFLDYDHLSPSGSAFVADTLYASGLLVTSEPRDVLREALGARATNVGTLVSALTTHPSAAVRAECAEALGAAVPAGRAAVPALFAALTDQSEAVRAFAVRALAKMDLGAGELPRLVQALESPDGYVVAFAAWTLGNMGAAAQTAVPALAQAFSRDDTNAVVAAALARIGPAAAEAVSVLQEALRSENPDRRWRAARTLGRIGPAAAPAVPLLTSALADPHNAVRQHAARALGRIGPAARPAAAALQKATGDWDAAVRREAREALDRLH
ncbi:MAG TPA: HEAT repeat domain-containing protein [Vicinamibacteria bacterium]|nr:HEAT repeat domain-containing protein [Vicinamibacteria bacterium]